MKIEIQKGVPLPTPMKQFGMYPFEAMDVGDSFCIEKEKASSMRAFLRRFTLENKDKNFTTRAVDNGVRTWRTK